MRLPQKTKSVEVKMIYRSSSNNSRGDYFFFRTKRGRLLEGGNCFKLFTKSRALNGGPIQKPYWLPWAPLPHLSLYVYFVFFGKKNDNNIFPLNEK